jgi:hypothetical protein
VNACLRRGIINIRPWRMARDGREVLAFGEGYAKNIPIGNGYVFRVLLELCRSKYYKIEIFFIDKSIFGIYLRKSCFTPIHQHAILVECFVVFTGMGRQRELIPFLNQEVREAKSEP